MFTEGVKGDPPLEDEFIMVDLERREVERLGVTHLQEGVDISSGCPPETIPVGVSIKDSEDLGDEFLQEDPLFGIEPDKTFGLDVYHEGLVKSEGVW